MTAPIETTAVPTAWPSDTETVTTPALTTAVKAKLTLLEFPGTVIAAGTCTAPAGLASTDRVKPLAGAGELRLTVNVVEPNAGIATSGGLTAMDRPVPIVTWEEEIGGELRPCSASAARAKGDNACCNRHDVGVKIATLWKPEFTPWTRGVA